MWYSSGQRFTPPGWRVAPSEGLGLRYSGARPARTKVGGGVHRRQSHYQYSGGAIPKSVAKNAGLAAKSGAEAYS